jgi:hypothetical protein
MAKIRYQLNISLYILSEESSILKSKFRVKIIDIMFFFFFFFLLRDVCVELCVEKI